MEFKYINMKAIEFGEGRGVVEKLRISKVLKECADIELFENDFSKEMSEIKPILK